MSACVGSLFLMTVAVFFSLDMSKPETAVTDGRSMVIEVVCVEGVRWVRSGWGVGWWEWSGRGRVGVVSEVESSWSFVPFPFPWPQIHTCV